MSKRMLFAHAEIAKPADFGKISKFAQDTSDQIVGDTIGYPAHWSAFTVSVKSAQEVRVSPGRYHAGEIVYASDEAIDVNLQAYLPIAASDEHWVALILRGRTETLNEAHPFADAGQDVETGAVVVRQTPKVEARTLSIVVQQSNAAPAPAQRPTIAETDACIAFVRLTTTGIQTIEPGEGWRAQSLYEVEGRVTRIELAQEAIAARTNTLETGMSNANAAIDELRAAQIRPEIWRQVRRDVAAMRRQVNVPEGARSDWYDPGLLLDQWDTTHPLWLARVDEGIQAAFAQVRTNRLELVNEDDPRIAFAGRRMVPAWTRAKRIFNEGGRKTRLISQLTHTEIETIQRSVARSRVDYGPTIHACENKEEWARFQPELHAKATFQRAGETWESLGIVLNDGLAGHQVYAARTKKTVHWTETYWEYQSKKVGLNGSVFGQSFLVDQPLICPEVELEFARVGPDGAVTVFFCEADETGAPRIADVVASARVEHAALRVGWVSFKPDLTNFDPGKRYAWFTVTTGNHTLYGSEGNKFSSGTSFRLSDGAWAQGDLEFDFNFRIYGCRFTNTRTVVEFKAMDLPDGMTQFKLLYPNWMPKGTAITWEVQPVFGGESAPWATLDPKVQGNPLVGLPSRVNLRATLLATPDLAPMIELSADAIYEAARTRADWRAVSKAINLGLTTTTIQTLNVIDDFDPALHTFSPRILAGASATLIVPDVSTTMVDPDRPARRAILSTYTVPAGTSVVRNAPGGNTTNVVTGFFGQNTALFAL